MKIEIGHLTDSQKAYAENHAMEIRLLAARRIGELVPAESPGRGKKIIRTSNNFPSPPRLTEFRKLADISIDEFISKKVVVTFDGTW